MSPEIINSLSQKQRSTFDDSKSQAKPNQLLLIRDLNKNVAHLILSYLNCNEIFVLILSSKQMALKHMADPMFRKIAVDAYFAFFFQ